MIVLDDAKYKTIRGVDTSVSMFVFYADKQMTLPTAPVTWSDLCALSSAHNGVGLIRKTNKVGSAVAGTTANMADTAGIPFGAGVTVYGIGIGATADDPQLVAIEYIKKPQMMRAGADAILMVLIGDDNE
jgi:hypothetical protein